jgi:DNA invertase Pin-like site-specific DNA recombinase
VPAADLIRLPGRRPSRARGSARRRLVIGYIRVSTLEQAREGHSLEAQEARLRAWAALQDSPLDRIIADDGYSARSLDRPGMREFLALVEGGKVARLLIARLDRITRSLRDLLELVERFHRHRVEFVSVADSIDTSNASGRLVLNLLGSIIQWQRENTAEATAETMASMMRQGRRVSRNPHFGYRLGPPRLVAMSNGANRWITGLEPDPREQEAIALMRAWRAEGCSLGRISAELEARGFTARSGRRLSPKVIRDVLRRPVP